MTINECHALKTKIWTFAAKSLVFGSRSKVCELQGIDADKDPICMDIRKDMDQLEQEIYSTIDGL